MIGDPLSRFSRPKPSAEAQRKRARIEAIWRETMGLGDDVDLVGFNEQWQFLLALLDADPNG